VPQPVPVWVPQWAGLCAPQRALSHCVPPWGGIVPHGLGCARRGTVDVVIWVICGMFTGICDVHGNLVNLMEFHL
jgi:hypothetical protein